MSFFVVLQFSKKMTSKDRENYKIINKIGLVVLLVIFGIVITIFAINNMFNTSLRDTNGDISNWTTLIVEIGIGIIIGLTIFIYSDGEQKKTKYILEEQVKKSKKRNEYVIKQIRYKFSFASDISPTAKELRECFSIEDEEERINKIEDVVHNLPYAIDELKIVQNLMSLYADDIEPDDIKLILRVAQNAQILSRFLNKEPEYLANCIENFEKSCKTFFKKFPHMDWSSNQSESLN